MISLGSWQKKEKFLILEVSAQKTSGFLINLDPDKNLGLEKFWPEFNWDKTPRRFKQRLEKWKVIVSTDPSLALTTILPIRLDREPEQIHKPLSSVELENLLAQTTAKVFTLVRGEASRELGIEELDTILIDNRVTNFKVDGHHVINPLDFKAKKIEAVLELTLTDRDVFNSWKNFFSIGETRNFFFTESARAGLFTLQKVKGLPLNLIILKNSRPSYVFTLEKAAVGEIVHRHQVQWATGVIPKVLEENLGVSSKVAQKLYELYLIDEVSSRVGHHFAFTLKPAFAPLLTQLEKLRIKGPAFLISDLKLPPFFPKRLGKVSLGSVSIVEISEKLGFKVEPTSWPWPVDQVFNHLAPFFEFYYNNEDLAINHWLRRRLHWLGSTR